MDIFINEEALRKILQNVLGQKYRMVLKGVNIASMIDDIIESIEKARPLSEQIPARPVVPVGPVTTEQRLEDLENRFNKMQMDIANILGMLGKRTEARR